MARNVFFSFHYDDIMRVNNIRKSGEFKEYVSDTGRDIEGFYDYSLWERKKGEGEDSLKRMIREGVERTSAVCVLVGTKTWLRPWVRYEIARSVIDGRGLLSVHINGIAHHQSPYKAHPLGEDPCRYIGVAKRDNGNYYLCEIISEKNAYSWKWYLRHTSPVKVPDYMPEPVMGFPLRLSDYVPMYDWANSGHKNIGGWIDKAAQGAGR